MYNVQRPTIHVQQNNCNFQGTKTELQLKESKESAAYLYNDVAIWRFVTGKMSW